MRNSTQFSHIGRVASGKVLGVLPLPGYRGSSVFAYLKCFPADFIAECEKIPFFFFGEILLFPIGSFLGCRSSCCAGDQCSGLLGCSSVLGEGAACLLLPSSSKVLELRQENLDWCLFLDCWLV